MKKIAAVVVSIGVILVIVGLVVVGIFADGQIGNLFGDFNHNLSKADQTAEIENYDETSDIKINNINIITNTYSVYIRPSETDTAYVKYPSETSKEYKVSIAAKVVNQTLEITESDNVSGKKIFNFVDIIFYPNDFIVVYLPQTERFTQAQLTINSNRSFVNIEGTTFDSAEITTEAGSITIDRLTTKTLSAKTSAGSIKLENTNAKSITAESSAGSINIDEVKADNVGLKSSAGSIHADNVECSTFKANADAGSVTVMDINATTLADIYVSAGSVKCEVDTPNLSVSSKAGSIKFTTNASLIKISSKTGSVNGTIEGVKSEYQIDVRKDTGSSNISNQTVQGATKHLSVEVNTGSIHIDFDED